MKPAPVLLRRALALAALALLPCAPLALRAATVAPVPTTLDGDKLVMTSTDDETVTTVTGNVVLTGTNLRITCDYLKIIALRFDSPEAKSDAIPNDQKIKYILATGNVHIVQGDRESTSQRAEVFPHEDKVVLSEDPVVIDKSNGFTGAGEIITLFRGKREIIVEKPKFTAPSIDDLGATASPRAAAKPAAPAQPGAATPPAPASGVTFPRPGGK